MPSHASRIADEEGLASTTASYTVVLSFSPRRLTPEKRRALAIVMRQKSSELLSLISLLVEQPTLELNISSSSFGMMRVDASEPIPEDE